jgi:hypothetical protein
MAGEVYENFPARIVILCNLLPLLIYASGAYILAGFGLWVAILYLAYCLWLEFKVLRRSCVNCYYYGNICGAGKGKLASWLFKPGNPEQFAEMEISWPDMIPDFLVSVFPLVGGIILLVIDFSWLLVALMVLLLVLTFAGNAIIRGSFMCKYCKQKEIGCPALELFGGKT